ncbi:MAG: DNA internalization-related competence protein ComEC/Rec2 [Anaerofustis stercorihominis]|nr:DNA internalization-related competence protein ComEC/Rec2 [Anaerofustis stercorihominis]
MNEHRGVGDKTKNIILTLQHINTANNQQTKTSMYKEKQHRIIDTWNKRPVILGALVCIAEILSVVHLHGIPKYLIPIILNIYMLVMLRRKAIAVFMCVISLFVFFKADGIYENSLLYENVYAENEFVVQVMTYGEADGQKVQYKVKSLYKNDASGTDNNDNILLRIYDPSVRLNVGDIYKIKGNLSGVKANTNPHTFNYKHYLLSNNVNYTLTADAENITYIHDDHLQFHYEKIFSLRSSFEALARKYMSERSAGLLMGIMFASDDVDGAVLEDFRALNVAHVLAVSGLHVGIVYSFFMGIISFLKIKNVRLRRILKSAALMFVFMYIILSGCTVSCIRAGFMIFMSSVASEITSLNRRYDTLNTLAVILLISVLFNPFVILGASFVLSYAAVLSIILINPILMDLSKKIPPLKKLLQNKIFSYIFSLICVSLSVQIGMIPINLAIFGKVSLLSALYNVIIVPLITLSLILGIIGFVMRFLACPIFGVVDILLGFAANMAAMLAVNDKFVLASYHVNGFAIVLYYSIALILFGYVNVKGKYAVLCISALLAVSLIFNVSDYLPGNSSVCFMDVGFGDCAIIRTKDNECIIIDGGGGFYGGDTAGEILLPYLYGEGIHKVNAIIATHSDADHMGGIVGMIGKIPIDTVYANDDGGVLYDELKELCRLYGVGTECLYSGDSISFTGCAINILSPDENRKYSTLNDRSIVSEVILDEVKFLFTGDANKDSERTVLENSETFALKYDILKSAHHGSDFATEEFMTRLFTDVCVISVGNNGYGLPKEEYINSLSAVGVKCLRTDEYGLIKIVPTGNGGYDIMNYTGGWHEVR